MNLKYSVLVIALLAVAASPAHSQNNCGVTPPTGTCMAPAAPLQVWCAGNNANSTCAGGTTWLGFDTSNPATGSWSHQFEGIDAVGLRASSLVPRPQPDPNGAVGPTDANGVGQYLELASNFVQAFDRKTSNGIFSNKPNSIAVPQSLNSLFAPAGSQYCKTGSLDGTASYDRIDNVFVLANLFNPGAAGTRYLCIGVSAPHGTVPANNLAGDGFKSYWNVYAYNVSVAIPNNAKGEPYFPDYMRFGSWSDGFYVAWDLLDTFSIVGFEVCKLDKADILAGLSSSAPVCYTYIPDYIGKGTNNSLIHTLLPADFEGGNPIPSTTAGEYFLAQINPSNPGTDKQCTALPCTSNQLAFWTWTGFTSGAGPTPITLSKAYTPGCYSPVHPYDTYCVPEPYGGKIDSVGDRLMSRLAYRYSTTAGQVGEYLAVTQTVQENAKFHRSGIRYYKILAGSNPTVVHQGDIQDATNNYFLSMPSVAMDSLGDLGITYTVTGNTSHGSLSDYDPSPFFVVVNPGGKLGTPVPILSNSGTSGQDETDQSWGEYVSVSSDPNDDKTFWAIDEYMKGDQTANCTSQLGTGCSWATRIYTCKKGSGC